MSDIRSAATIDQRDPFADDVLERLIRSNQDYQRSHGHYIVPLAERLLATRQKLIALLDERDHYRVALEHLHSPGRRQDIDQGRGLTHYIGDVLRHVE